MSKSEILAELPKLSARERLEVRARLAELDQSTDPASVHDSPEARRRAKLINALVGSYSVEADEALVRLKRQMRSFHGIISCQPNRRAAICLRILPGLA